MNTSGFELIQERFVPEINSNVGHYRHLKTGAELLSIENDDAAKAFGVSFRTIPPNSTGVAHILEHIVLSGSQRFPVKEPFVELLKSSLAYFINALTFDDKTIYPVSSPNKQDFYNLVDVYLDAVFHPLLKETAFKQEGWHLALASIEQGVEYQGVVFNEMKGQISNPDTILALETQKTLMPDTHYGFSSGGDPEVIPELTYDQFLSFYETYYHPSNALFYFYGDDPLQERLHKIDSVIGTFEKSEPAQLAAVQPAFKHPRTVRTGYPSGEDPDSKAMGGVSWLLPINDNPEVALSISILAHILMGTPASPLRKALSESGLGEEVYGSGYEGGLEVFNFINQLSFTAGLKGVNEEAVEQVEPLILRTLEDLVNGGIDPEAIQAAMNTIEFQLREANFGRIPRGLMYMVVALSYWNYGRDPYSLLEFTKPLSQIKSNFDKDPAFFEGLIRQQLLDNQHRVFLQLIPDPNFLREREQVEKARLEKLDRALTDEERDRLMSATLELRELQQAPDRPEDLASLPVLDLVDLDPETSVIPLEVVEKQGVRVLYHDLPTYGITYLDLGFDLRTLEADQLPFVPLIGRALIEMGTEREDAVQIAQRIGRDTGGIESETFTSAVRNSQDGRVYLFLRAKVMSDRFDRIVSILNDLLLLPDIDQQSHFRQLVLEEKTRLESALIPQGYFVVEGRLRAGFDVSGWAQEQLEGVEYLFFLRRLAKQVESDWPAVLQKLEDILRVLVNRQTMICNLTMQSDAIKPTLKSIDAFLKGLPAAARELKTWPSWRPDNHEGLVLPAQVNYVGKGVNIYDLGYDLNGSILVVLQHLRLAYLWEKIRVMGGAYGAFSSFDPLTGGLTFASYRDPNIRSTLEAYDNVAVFLRENQPDERELSNAIISTIGRTDPYRLPDAQGYSSMIRYLTNVSDAYRQSIRDQILGTSRADFKNLSDVLDRISTAGRVVVMGSRERLEGLNAMEGAPSLDIKALL